MSKRTRHMLIAAGAAVLAAAGVFAFSTPRKPPSAAEPVEATTPAQARALGARWRKNRDVDLGRDYARALVLAGLYDELLTEIAENGLFASDAQSARMYESEAYLRQGRYSDALARSAGANPYFAYARARAGYAMAGDVAAAEADIAAALRGPRELAAEAWLFRARVALDENDFEKAEAVRHRAADEGAAAERTELVAIERAIRTGELAAAAKALDKRRRRGRSTPATADEMRLAALIRLRAGDAWGAMSILDRLEISQIGAQGPLLSAVAKREVGDLAQAWGLVNDVLNEGPGNWRALDIAQAIAADQNRAAVRQSLIEKLGQARPALAALRQLQDPSLSNDRKFEALRRISAADRATGAAASLLGPGATLNGLPEASDFDAALIALAGGVGDNDLTRIRAVLPAIIAADPAPLPLAVAGLGFQAVGENAQAAAAFAQAYQMSPDFFAPQHLHSKLLAADGDVAAAAELMRAYLSRTPTEDRARLALGEYELARGDAAAAVEAFAGAAPALAFADAQTAMLYAAAAKATGGEALKTMISRARINAPSAIILANALEAAGDGAGAAGAFRLAAISEPENEEYLASYVAMMTALGRAEEAASLVRLLDERRESRHAPAGGGGPISPESADSMVNFRQ